MHVKPHILKYSMHINCIQDGKTTMRAKTLLRKVTLRYKEEDYQKLHEQSSFAGISLSELIRRKSQGGRIIAQTDEITVRELRRLGGLLKSNFTTLRESGVSKEIIILQEQTLSQIIFTIDKIGSQNDNKKNKK